MKTGLGLVAAVGATLLGIAMISKFETPGQVTVQRGFRGVAMETNYNPKVLASPSISFPQARLTAGVRV
jgi:hypothetical protein